VKNFECAKIYANDYKDANKILTKTLKYFHRNNAHTQKKCGMNNKETLKPGSHLCNKHNTSDICTNISTGKKELRADLLSVSLFMPHFFCVFALLLASDSETAHYFV